MRMSDGDDVDSCSRPGCDSTKESPSRQQGTLSFLTYSSYSTGQPSWADHTHKGHPQTRPITPLDRDVIVSFPETIDVDVDDDLGHELAL